MDITNLTELPPLIYLAGIALAYTHDDDDPEETPKAD